MYRIGSLLSIRPTSNPPSSPLLSSSAGLMYKSASCCRYSKWLPLACFSSARWSSSRPSRSVMTVSSLPCIPRVALNQSLISLSLSVTCSIVAPLVSIDHRPVEVTGIFRRPAYGLGVLFPANLRDNDTVTGFRHPPSQVRDLAYRLRQLIGNVKVTQPTYLFLDLFADLVYGHSFSLSTAASPGASLILPPRYRSVVTTDSWPRVNCICSIGAPLSLSRWARVRRRSCGAQRRPSTCSEYFLTIAQTW